jgi:anhydro-N-acetylmuramic acid kinase
MLLNGLLSHPYFAETAPKSTGREVFNLNWLEQQIATLPHAIDEHSVQTTLVMLTCHSIAEQVNLLEDVQQLYVCGGGAQNDFMMECLANELFDCELYNTAELGIHPDAVEAMAFAWFAYAHQHKQTSNIPSVTGARKAAVLGGYFPAL